MHAVCPTAMKRTHTCGDLAKAHVGSDVCLQGWVSTRRDHGGVIFVDMRDRYGLTQVVFNPGCKGFEEAERLRREDCIEVCGRVRSRPTGMTNPNLVTGEIEVVVSALVIHNKSDVPPIEIDNRIGASDEMRLRYRYLDLRRPVMQENLALRHKAAMATRYFLSERGFLEIETPLLVRATPEGARDYVVPSRVHHGRFYALPQSPQLYKQILMVAGCDKYFQLPRCLRDEDLRTDRQPEFTQIDIEMSFPELDDIYALGEQLLAHQLKECIGYALPTPIPRISHKEAMAKYGTDKPDIRYELFLHDVSGIAKQSEFTVFKDVIKNGGVVKCLACPSDLARKDIDKYIEFCQHLGAKGMAWMRVKDKKTLESNIAKYFSPEQQEALINLTKAKPGYVLMFIADSVKMANLILDKLRQDLGAKLNLYNLKKFAACWIVQFPLFEWNEEEEQWEPAHHPFCMPIEEDMKYLESDPGKVYCTQYDMVLNGVEILSGSIRIHRPEIQERVLKVIGLSINDIKEKFGFLLESFKYGAPPHGGFAMGFDRIVALMRGTNDIREVIAFPKNKAAECPMDGSPGTVPAQSLKELGITIQEAKKEK